MLLSMHHAGEIPTLSGAPGCGKTTIASAMADLPGSRKAHLHSDDFWHFIRNGRISPYAPNAHAQNAVIMNALAGIVENFAEGGYFVILDGVVGPWFLEPFRALTVPVHYIVLHIPAETASELCRERGDDTLIDPEVIAELHQQFSSLGSLEKHALDVGRCSREEARRRVMDAAERQEYLPR